MNLALFGMVRIGSTNTARFSYQQQCPRNLQALWDQRFDRLSALLAELVEN
jgi:hypothetical protein